MFDWFVLIWLALLTFAVFCVAWRRSNDGFDQIALNSRLTKLESKVSHVVARENRNAQKVREVFRKAARILGLDESKS